MALQATTAQAASFDEFKPGCGSARVLLFVLNHEVLLLQLGCWPPSRASVEFKLDVTQSQSVVFTVSFPFPADIKRQL